MRRWLTALACDFVISFGACAQAQTTPPPPGLPHTGMLSDGRLFLVSGDRAVFAVEADGRSRFVSAGPASPSADAKEPGAGLNEGQVSFALTAGKDGNAILVADSRAVKPLRYLARIVAVRDGKTLSAPTSTCPLRPGVSDFEAWPNPLPAVVIVSIEEAKPDDTACR